MKRLFSLVLAALTVHSCADLERPEVFNDDNAMDGWWYLAELSGIGNTQWKIYKLY